MTSQPIPFEKKELKELLNKGWMTHDAMWFYNCLQECGIEKTNRINKAAIRDMSVIEIKRIQKALGIDTFDTFDELKRFFYTVMEIVTGEFMKYTLHVPARNLLHVE